MSGPDFRGDGHRHEGRGAEEEPDSASLPLEGLRVVDAASLFAGPVIGTILGDYGADVVKVEHPRGDSLRTLGWAKDGVSLWWELVGRNKRSVALSLSDPRGAEAMRRLVADADVLVENFRPGTMERWGLGWEELHEINPRLVMVRTTGFGQTGPYASRPGFGTLAEAMSGFAYINGHADGPPTLPPFALADGVAALTGTFATMIALWWRERSGEGQMIDLSIYEPMFWLLGPQASVFQQLGLVQERTGNRAPFTAPRNAYRTRDGHWVVLSGSAQSIAERIVEAVGRSDLVSEPWFRDHTGRLDHQDELDEAIGAWIAARDRDEVIQVFQEHQAALGPVLSIADILENEQYRARGTITEVEHPILGPLQMQDVIPRLGATPGRIRSIAPRLGQHTAEILASVGYSPEQLAEMREEGVIALEHGPTEHEPAVSARNAGQGDDQ